VGGFLASLLEPHVGVPGTYLFAAGVSLAACVLAGALLRKTNTAAPVTGKQPRLPYATMLPLLRNPRIAFLCMVQLLMSTCFTGVVLPFFPLLAQSKGAASADVSALFSLRAFGSMATRLPFGLLSNRVPRQRLMMLALTAVALMLIAMGRAPLVPVLAAFLVIEGIGFGLNITVGQAAITETVEAGERGAAIGLHSMASSLGSTLSPFLLGALAAATSVPLVFQITGAGALITCWVAWWLLRNRRLVSPA
jgi:MFS family permease